jgi:hypothetical protein
MICRCCGKPCEYCDCELGCCCEANDAPAC